MGFVKRFGKWGLLTKPDTVEGKWHLVTSARHIFDNEVDAYKSALEMTSKGRYLYRPVPVTIEYEYKEGE